MSVFSKPLICEILTGTVTPGQSEFENHANEGIILIRLTLGEDHPNQMQFSVIPVNGFKYCYLTLIIFFNINDLFAHS